MSEDAQRTDATDTDASEGATAASAAHRYVPARDGWKERFLQAIGAMPNVRAACEMANVSRSGAYWAKAHDDEFSAAWDTAIEEAIDRLEQAAWERATVGRQRIHRTFRKDGKIASETIEDIVSDRLAELMLKAHRPDKYIERLRLGREPDDNEVDRDIMELARDLQTIRDGVRGELGQGGDQAPDIIEAEVIEGQRGSDA